jgi:hypothetical protein
MAPTILLLSALVVQKTRKTFIGKEFSRNRAYTTHAQDHLH